MLDGRKVLITGHTGKIGGAIATRYASKCELWGLARYSREGSLAETERLGIRAVRGDLSLEGLAKVPTDFDYVINVGAAIAPRTAEEGMRSNSDGPARLMNHCKSAKAFLHVSTCGVYKQSSDPHHIFGEDSDLGNAFEAMDSGQYVATKLAGEGAVRAACFILGLPTIICRQNVQYGGPHVPGGLVDYYLDRFVETGEAYLPSEGPFITSLIHEDDICDLVEPSLAAAAVPAEIVNWSSDEYTNWQELFEYAGELLGKAPSFVRTTEFDFPAYCADGTKRRRIAGPSKVTWKEGVRRSLKLRHPELVLNTPV